MQIPTIKLKHTDLEVSRFCFGTMTFGKPLDQAGATQLVNRCIEDGINFFDTANVYQKGVAETMFGHAIKGRRDNVFLMTKVCTHGRSGITRWVLGSWPPSFKTVSKRFPEEIY